MTIERTNQVFGTFVVWGSEAAPEVHMLDEPAYRRYMNWPANKRSLAIRATFGIHMEHAVPAWIVASVEQVAMGYDGPHGQRVRYICACIALNKPYGPDENGKPDGGTKVKPPGGPAPKSPSPRKRVLSIVDESEALHIESHQE
jgi:hypothetical protein